MEGWKGEKDKKNQKLNINGVEIDYNFDRETVYSITGNGVKDSITSFADPVLGLDDKILKNIKKAGLAHPTPIQRHAMSQIMGKLDVMCCSHTGSGKTAAYLLPLINLIPREQFTTNLGASYPKILVLTPTRELTEQIKNEAVLLSESLPVKSMAMFGGQSMGYELRKLRKGDIDILVATPGRLMHILSEFDVLCLKETKYLVFDEADEMFNLGFFSQINDIVRNYMKPKDDRVNIMFSATFPQQIQYFAKKHLRSDNVFVVIGILGGASPDVCQEVLSVSGVEKQIKLYEIIQKLDTQEKLLVFCNTIEMVDSVASFLKLKEVNHAAIHSSFSQYERTQALQDFDQGRCKVLVATSVAARGLNIKNVQLVLNYDMPKEIEEYVQRVGRTGRIGVAGTAISFFDCDKDADIASDLCSALRSVHQPVPEFLTDAVPDNSVEEADEHPNVDVIEKMKKFKMPTVIDYHDDDDWWG